MQNNIQIDGYKLYKAFFDRLENDEKSEAPAPKEQQHNLVPVIKNDIRAELVILQRSFVKLGKMLCDLYELPLGWYYASKHMRDIPGRYKKFMAFCEKEFGLRTTTVKNYMGVALRYGERDAEGKLTGELVPVYEKYKYSNLVEMLPIERALPPTANRKEIRELKRELRQGQLADLEKKSADGGGDFWWRPREMKIITAWGDTLKVLFKDLGLEYTDETREKYYSLFYENAVGRIVDRTKKAPSAPIDSRPGRSSELSDEDLADVLENIEGFADVARKK